MTTATRPVSGTVTNTAKVSLRALVGAGDKIMIAVLPSLIAGVAANVWRPAWFAVGGTAFDAIGWTLLGIGVVGWLWSVALILTLVPKHRLITSGPFALVKHPLYTAVSLLVLPAVGLLLGTWLGIALGTVMYVASRRYAPAEERALAEEFGAEWDAYERRVLLPWL